MVNSIAPGTWKRFVWAAVIGVIIFIVTQLSPFQSSSMEDPTQTGIISKEMAEQTAIQFAKEQFKQTSDTANTIYQTDSLAAGYFSKQKLSSEYDKKYGRDFPYDTYQVTLKLANGDDAFVYVHMNSNKVVGWHRPGGAQYAEEQAYINAAKQFAVTKNFRESELADAKLGNNGEVLFHPTGYKLGEASLELTVALSEDASGKPFVIRYKAAFIPPEGYADLIDNQKSKANILSIVSLLYMSLMSLVLAIIYAVLYRKHTTFKRGLFISALFTVFYLYLNVSMVDGMMAEYGEVASGSQEKIVMQFITVLLLLPVVIAVYFSLVAGDGMWRSWKRPIWPGFRERGYGEHVWRSVGLSYLLALILMGIQSVIFLILEKSIGSWVTTDAATSTYNMGALWLMPTLAWCAAISEEAIYRLFGIAIFKRWLKNTFVAALIPTIMWALGHVGYPIFPYYTRLIELLVIGLLFCFIFLRFGFITAVFTHAIFDTFLMDLSLIATGDPFNIGAAIVYAVLPVIIAWVIKYWYNRRQAPASPVWNQSSPPDAT
ncbi:CPBP family intramembrane glutamic endopeptidase [Paenibacillus sp. NEAU-GSW1]|uniref:CPBP family intramembrane glutamic endopeptidase n=1 Tax=Paenibacillus sp. NEAU-GSW1 TaxID=2682486 RepID=UPI0012E1C915|nr:CPBP family intramembrane glutamic endopeptidase [Paenibacillus sp. NEAU-GSW1]MUT64337.1 CPBP family intramembrane metalloprotease [Paenibacillus sp. NEAU-GSW1]